MGLFPTPLIKIDLQDNEKAKRFFYEVVAVSENLPAGLTHYHSGENVFDLYSELVWLKVNLLEAGRFAYQELLNHKRFGSMTITNAWFNLCEVGGSQLAHTHANNLLSGTYYLNTDADSEIEFHHPLSTSALHPELFDEPDGRVNTHGLCYHKRKVGVSVASGDCLFWPSQIKHGYTNNRTPERLSLSFNMMPTILNTTYQNN